MEKYDKKELLTALNYIQCVCENFDNCDKCPLNTEDDCMITHGAPVDWNLKNQKMSKFGEHINIGNRRYNPPKTNRNRKEQNMELEYFEKTIIPRLEESEFFCCCEKLENQTQYIYILTIGTEYHGYEEFLIYFDKNTKKFINLG